MEEITELAIYGGSVPNFGNTGRYMNYCGLVFMNHICFGDIDDTSGNRKCIICGELYKE